MSKVEGWIAGLRAEVVGVVRPSQSHHVWGRVVRFARARDRRPGRRFNTGIALTELPSAYGAGAMTRASLGR